MDQTVQTYYTLAEKQVKKKNFFNSNLFILSCLVLAVAITIGVSWSNGLFSKGLFSQQPKTAQRPVKLTPKQALYNQIYSLFSGRDQNIVSTLQLANGQASDKIAYTYYVRLYQQMTAYYKQTNNPDVKIALASVKKYSLHYDQYNDGDFK